MMMATNIISNSNEPATPAITGSGMPPPDFLFPPLGAAKDKIK